MENVGKLFDLNKIILMNASLVQYKNKIALRDEDVCCVRRDGKLAIFGNKDKVLRSFITYIDLWKNNFGKAQNLKDVARSSAHFWLTFISIHPFEDGNGRTAKKLLEKIVTMKGFKVKSYYFIDRYLFKGDVKEDLFHLENLFVASLEKNNLRKEAS